MIPLNLAQEGDVTDYVVTGAWSKKALEEGQKYTKANVAAKGRLLGHSVCVCVCACVCVCVCVCVGEG